MTKRCLIRLIRSPGSTLVDRLGHHSRPDDRQRRDQLHERRVVVIEAKSPLLPVTHPGRQVEYLVDRRVFLKQTLCRQSVVQREQPSHRHARPKPASERFREPAPRSGGVAQAPAARVIPPPAQPPGAGRRADSRTTVRERTGFLANQTPRNKGWVMNDRSCGRGARCNRRAKGAVTMQPRAAPWERI